MVPIHFRTDHCCTKHELKCQKTRHLSVTMNFSDIGGGGGGEELQQRSKMKKKKKKDREHRFCGFCQI